MKSLNDWYTKYGFTLGARWAEGVSQLFSKWCTRGHLVCVGVVAKATRMYSKKKKLNASFEQYLNLKGEDPPTGYGLCKIGLDPAFKSFAKYDKGQFAKDERSWFEAGMWTERTYLPIMGSCQILEKEQVLSEMDLTTSPGIPWNDKYRNKTDFLTSPSEAVLDDYYALAGTENPDELMAIFKVSQKSEMVTEAKILANKVRTFTGAPIELSVLCNRLYLQMNERFYASNITRSTNPNMTSFVGGSKFGGGWNVLYRKLNAHPNAFELDESAYDASLFQDAMSGMRDLRWNALSGEYQTDENWNRVCHTYNALTHSLVVMENRDLLQKSTGNPSGSTNTIVDNTLILDRLFNYAWIVNAKRVGRDVDQSDMQRNVAAALNGDDNTFTVSDECVSWFNAKNISEVWSAVGVTTTTPCWTPRELRDVDFLSQSFQIDENTGKYYPSPDRNKVLSSLLMASSLNDVRWHYLRACALRIESFWNLECRRIIHGYINYLEQEFGNELVGSVREMTMENIRAVYMTDAQIKALYSGMESGYQDRCSGLYENVYETW